MSRTRGLSLYLRVVSRLRSLRETSVPPPVDGEAPPRLSERFGEASEPRSDGPLIWLHAAEAADVGWLPVLSMELAEERGEDVALLLTTDAPSDRGGDGVVHQMVPTESQRAVTRFLDHWQPNIGILLNAPDRPVLISKAAERDIPLVLAATRRAQTPAPRIPLFSGAVLNCFDRVLAASAADAEAFRKQGVPPDRLEIAGPLSDLAVPPTADAEEQNAWVKAINGRPVWLAAAVTAPEVKAVVEAHHMASRMSHRLLLILVPRDADAADELEATLTADGWNVANSSAQEALKASDHILIGSPERLGLWLRLAAISFLGGTLDPDAPAYDPYMPASLGSAVVHGPHATPFERRFDRLARSAATQRIRTAEDLAGTVLALLAPDRTADLAHAGWAVTSEGAAGLSRLTELINRLLDGETI